MSLAHVVQEKNINNVMVGCLNKDKINSYLDYGC
jgi:hypothetical protein